MKKIVLIIFLSFPICVSSQSSFNKFYDNFIDGSFDIMETNSGFLFPLMALQSNFSRLVILHKLDNKGDIIWSKQFGNPNTDILFALSIIQVEDSNYVMGAQYRHGTVDYYLQKVDQYGDSIWFNNYQPDEGFDYFGAYATLASDSGFIICGQKVDTASNNSNAHILKTDKDGNYIWDVEYPGIRFDAGSAACELPDKGFLIAGWTRSYGFGSSSNRDGYLIRVDSAGNYLWHETFGGTENDLLLGITKTQDGNFLLSGSTVSNSQAYAWVIKVDTLGSIIWEKKLKFLGGAGADCYWVRELINGDIVGGASDRKPSNLQDDGMIFLLDSLGSVKWYRTFTVGNSHAYFRNIKPTTDGGFVCTGFAFDPPSTGGQDAWVVKLDSAGCDSLGCANYTSIFEVSAKYNLLRVYPNPTSRSFSINLSQNYRKINMSIFNSIGMMVHSKNFSERQNIECDIDLSPGLYIIRVTSENELIGTSRLMKL